MLTWDTKSGFHPKTEFLEELGSTFKLNTLNIQMVVPKGMRGYFIVVSVVVSVV